MKSGGFQLSRVLIAVLLISGCSDVRFKAEGSQGSPAVKVNTESASQLQREQVFLATPSALYSMNPINRQIARLGEFSPVVSMRGITLNSTGDLFGVDEHQLWSVDPETAKLSPIAVLPATFQGRVHGLGISPDGRLIVGGKGLMFFDLKKKTFDFVDQTRGRQPAGGVVVLSGQFIYFTEDFESSGILIEVDMRTWSMAVPTFFKELKTRGLAFAGGSLFGFSENGDIFQINSQTGATSDFSSSSFSWQGATSGILRLMPGR